MAKIATDTNNIHTAWVQKRTLDEEGRGKYVKNVKCSMMMSYASGKRLIETCYKKKDIADWLVCSALLGGYAKWLFIYTLFCTHLFIGCVVVCNGIFVLVCAHVFAVSFCCCSPHSYSLPRRWYYNKYTTFLLCNSVAERNRNARNQRKYTNTNASKYKIKCKHLQLQFIFMSIEVELCNNNNCATITLPCKLSCYVGTQCAQCSIIG